MSEALYTHLPLVPPAQLGELKSSERTLRSRVKNLSNELALLKKGWALYRAQYLYNYTDYCTMQQASLRQCLSCRNNAIFATAHTTYILRLSGCVKQSTRHIITSCWFSPLQDAFLSVELPPTKTHASLLFFLRFQEDSLIVCCWLWR